MRHLQDEIASLREELAGRNKVASELEIEHAQLRAEFLRYKDDIASVREEISSKDKVLKTITMEQTQLFDKVEHHR